jgi:hypothetical protein
MTGLDIDFTELAEQARVMDQQRRTVPGRSS